MNDRSIMSLKKRALRRTKTLLRDPETQEVIRPSKFSEFMAKVKAPFTRQFWEDALERTDDETLVDGKLLSYAYLEAGLIEFAGAYVPKGRLSPMVSPAERVATCLDSRHTLLCSSRTVSLRETFAGRSLHSLRTLQSVSNVSLLLVMPCLIACCSLLPERLAGLHQQPRPTHTR